MAKVLCAEISCKYNDRHLCKAKNVNFSAGHVHTVNNGFMQVWKCRTFEADAEYKKMEAEIAKFLGLEDLADV